MTALAHELSDRPLLPSGLELKPARHRLFEAALVLFGDRGYDAVSVRDIVNAMGVTPAVLYFHVPSKEHLLYALVRIGHESHHERLKEALLGTGPEPEEQLRSLVTAHVLQHMELPELARVTHREIRALAPEHLAAIKLIRTQNEQMWLDVIKRGVRLGLFEVENARLTVLAINAMGIRTVEWLNLDDVPGPSEVARIFSDHAVRLVRTPSGALS